MTMILKTFAVAALATTAIVSSAWAEIGCDRGASSGATTANSCRFEAYRNVQSAQRAFALAPKASKVRNAPVQNDPRGYNPDPDSSVKQWGGVEM